MTYTEELETVLTSKHRKSWPTRQRSNWAKTNRRTAKKKLALILPAHNEELIIQTTIRSAIAAGQKKEDIYVVDDASHDSTRKKAIELLGKRQVLTVEHSGKAGAIFKAINHFQIVDSYHWVHIADADSIFGFDYFRFYRAQLKGKEYAAAVGFVQSLRGNWICKYRAFSYTYGQHNIRRLQSWFGMISVMPGPITSYRTEILSKLDFHSESLTEDFDITLQIHRKKLGRIKFIPEAVNYTQDPQTLRDFWKQTQRWYRGFFQGVTKYKIGTKAQRIDVSVGYQLLETLLYIVQVWIVLPLIVILANKPELIPVIIIGDMLLLALMALYASAMIVRPSMLLAVPLFYILRNIELIIYVKTFIEVVLLKRFRSKLQVGWATDGRRYEISKGALKDTTIG